MEPTLIIAGVLVVGVAAYIASNVRQSAKLISGYYRWIDENYSGPRWLRPWPIRPDSTQAKVFVWLLVVALGVLGIAFIVRGIVSY